MSQQWRRPGKSKEGMKVSLPPKLVEKLVWVPVISFCKISFPVTHLIPYYAGTGRSRPLALRITLIFESSLIDQIHPRVRYIG